jgi:sulfate/thiosulfate transport system ATP-binding protein
MIDGAEEVMVERVSHLGFEVRVELAMANGDHAWSQVTRAQAEELELEPGQIIFARPSRTKVFDAEPDTDPTAEFQVA